MALYTDVTFCRKRQDFFYVARPVFFGMELIYVFSIILISSHPLMLAGVWSLTKHMDARTKPLVNYQGYKNLLLDQFLKSLIYLYLFGIFYVYIIYLIYLENN